jgi:hypothetical protein
MKSRDMGRSISSPYGVLRNLFAGAVMAVDLARFGVGNVVCTWRIVVCNQAGMIGLPDNTILRFMIVKI